ncbi:MAG: hypothetical protein H6Q54_1407 [Deltaproteobacteria bacterium]|nr:hypothetical protein [Deltaproteobacteria bacterium]
MLMKYERNHMTINRKKIRMYLLASLGRTKRSWNVRSHASILSKGLCLCLLVVCFTPHQAAATDSAAQLSKPSRSLSVQEGTTALLSVETQPVMTPVPLAKRANFEQEHVSRDARLVADWVVDSGDNRGMSFVIVDKMDAKVFVFYADGRLRGAAPALLGMALGDEAIPGIGNRAMSSIRPEERTTPAGRFVAYLGINFYRKDILWVDYEGAVSLHRVVTNKPAERRLERLATPTPLDNRISYGCINVPAKFFDKVVKPAFAKTTGIVYVLPEIKSTSEIFASYYDVEQRSRKDATVDLNK